MERVYAVVNTTTITADNVAERAWNNLGALLAASIGADLFQYALELDNNGTVWLDSTWLLTALVLNTRSNYDH